MDKGAEYYAAYLSGNASMLEQIVDSYKDGLILFLNGYVHDIYAAEDLCEDTFFRLMVKKPHYDGSTSFKTWLYGIGKRLAFNFIKRNKRIAFSGEEEAARQADEYSLEETYVKTERHAALHACIKQLTEDERALIWLTYFEDASVKDAAKLFGKSENAMSAKLFRIRKKLAKMLTERGYGNENDSDDDAKSE